MVKFISLFAGCGGSSLGYKMAGFDELLAIEWDNNSIETLKLNFKGLDILQADINKLSGQDILNRINMKKGELDLLDASPPCQGFSMAGKRKITDSRNDLFKKTVELINEIQPKVFVIENVKGMLIGNMKGYTKEIMRELDKSNYNYKIKLMNAKYYNVPQSRERTIFIGYRKDIGIMPTFPIPSNKLITVREALKGIINKTFLEPNAKYKNLMKKVKSGQNLSKIFKTSYYSYVKAPKDKPCMTMTKSVCYGKISIYHYEEDRNLSIEEAKRICSFTDDFNFIGNYEEQWARMGNAVMPNMMKAIALNIKKDMGW